MRFGRFVLVEPDGSAVACAVVAPGHVFARRGPHAAVRDLSYAAVWTDERLTAVETELADLEAARLHTVSTAQPSLHAVLHALEPSTLASVAGIGRCRSAVRGWIRRQLIRELRATPVRPIAPAH